MSILGDELPSSTSEDFGFKPLGKIALLPGYQEQLPFSKLHNLAISNDAKLYAAASKDKVVVGTLDSLRHKLDSQEQADAADGESAESSEALKFLAKKEIENVVFVGFTGTANAVVFTTRDGAFFVFEIQQQEWRVLDALLPSNSTPVASVKSIPTTPDSFFVQLSDKLYRASISGTCTLVAENVTDFDTGLDNYALLYQDGSVEVHHGYSKDLNPEKFSLPSDISNEDADEFSPLSILTLSKGRYLVVFGNLVTEADEDVAYDHKIYAVDVTSNGKSTFQESFDIAPAFGSILRNPTYYGISLYNLGPSIPHVYVVSSATSSEVTLLDDQSVIQPNQDGDRAVLPINQDTDNDTNPVGMAVDLTAEQQIGEPCQGVDAASDLPVFFLLNNEGDLLAYALFNASGIKKDEFSAQNSLKKMRHIVANNKNEAHSTAGDTPNTSGNFSLDNDERSTSTFESSSATSKNPSKESSFFSFQPTTSNSKLPSEIQSSEERKELSAFGKPSFGQSSFDRPAFGAPSFGKSSFMSSTNTATTENSQGAEQHSTTAASPVANTTNDAGPGSVSSSGPTPPFGKPAFGNFGSNPNSFALGSTDSVEGSAKTTAFGAPAFGKPQFGTSNTFGHFNTNHTASHDSQGAKLGQSAFGEPAFGTKPFGSSFTKAENPKFDTPAKNAFGSFSTFANTDSPFAKLSSGSSTFSSAPAFGGSTASPFSSQQKSSATASNPFASLTERMAELKNTESPFAHFQNSNSDSKKDESTIGGEEDKDKDEDEDEEEEEEEEEEKDEDEDEDEDDDDDDDENTDDNEKSVAEGAGLNELENEAPLSATKEHSERSAIDKSSFDESSRSESDSDSDLEEQTSECDSLAEWLKKKSANTNHTGDSAFALSPQDPNKEAASSTFGFGSQKRNEKQAGHQESTETAKHISSKSTLDQNTGDKQESVDQIENVPSEAEEDKVEAEQSKDVEDISEKESSVDSSQPSQNNLASTTNGSDSDELKREKDEPASEILPDLYTSKRTEGSTEAESFDDLEDLKDELAEIEPKGSQVKEDGLGTAAKVSPDTITQGLQTIPIETVTNNMQASPDVHDAETETDPIKTKEVGSQSFEDDEVYLSQQYYPQKLGTFYTSAKVLSDPSLSTNETVRRIEATFNVVSAELELLSSNLSTIGGFIEDQSKKPFERTAVTIFQNYTWRLEESSVMNAIVDDMFTGFQYSSKEVSHLANETENMIDQDISKLKEKQFLLRSFYSQLKDIGQQHDNTLGALDFRQTQIQHKLRSRLAQAQDRVEHISEVLQLLKLQTSKSNLNQARLACDLTQGSAYRGNLLEAIQALRKEVADLKLRDRNIVKFSDSDRAMQTAAISALKLTLDTKRQIGQVFLSRSAQGV